MFEGMDQDTFTFCVCDNMPPLHTIVIGLPMVVVTKLNWVILLLST